MSTAAFLRLSLTAAFALLLFAAPVGAADAVTITGVSVGLPVSGRPVERDDPGVSKFGAWAPVYVSLEVTGDVSEPAELLFEAPDADEVTTTLAIPINLNGVAPGTTVYAPDRGALGYVRPAGASSQLTVTVRTKNGTPISAPHRVRLRPREPLQYVVLALGGAPAGFELPKPATGTDTGPLRHGRVELAHIDTFADLPDQWFGYETADLVILNTGTAADTFLRQLFGSAAPADLRKREALVEWVRRGGRLVISVGANAKLVSELPALNSLLPYGLIDLPALNAFLPYPWWPGRPARTTDAVALYWSAAGSANQANILSGSLGTRGGPPFNLANLVPQPGKSARVVIPPPARQTEDREPIAAQSALGLGRVTVIGFDLDRAPFAEFPQRPEFWDWVLREAGTARASGGGDGKARPPGALTEDEDEAAVAIRQHNDSFEGVAVVSFGWIALLIVLYLLLIGPLEYYFLKRVFRRLELTWLTLPVIVVTVSVLAYLSATAVKGRELRVNKVDVIDVDPESNRVYGSTWFTVFSPKIDTYTVGVTPGEGWGDLPYTGTTVNSVGAPRGGRPGIVRRKYTIHSEEGVVASGLENVPIQVWSTKAFSANWTSLFLSVTPAQPGQYLGTDLAHPPGDRTKVVGNFTHNLPVPVLTDCVAFYAGEAYPIPGDVILRGEPVRLVLERGTAAPQWLQSKGYLDAMLNRVQSYAERPGQKLAQKAGQPQTRSSPLPMWAVLFHEGLLRNEEGVFARNASLRRLDQSWRLSPHHRDEVIIVGRTAVQHGPADEVFSGPNSPSQLWLKGLPGSGERPQITGTARQETWVRFYLPVR